MNIRVKWLANHGLVVTRKTYNESARRFIPPDGNVAVIEAAIALGVNDMRIYRLLREGRIKCRMVNGEKRIPLSEIRRMRDNPQELRRPINKKVAK